MSRFSIFPACRWWLALSWCAAALSAADTRPIVGPGATKDAVIDAYGWPSGQSHSGTKEILTYTQGTVTLDNGRVERVDFSPNVPWQTPRPRPGPTPTSTAKPANDAFDPWTTSLATAKAEAAKQHGRILAAFTGSDWSPPSQRFLDDVAKHPDFVNPLMGDFVFLAVDFPTRVAPPEELRKQNEELRRRCGVSTYPALVVLSPAGEPLAAVDLTKESTAENYRATVIAAVLEVRDLLKTKPQQIVPPKPIATAPAVPTALPPAPPPTPAPATVAGDAKPSQASGLVGAIMSSARWDLLLGLGGGAVFVALLVWWLWRSSPVVNRAKEEPQKSVLTGLGLGGLPTAAELATWPVERLQLLVTGLFEAGGYQVTPRASNPSEFNLVRTADPKVRVIVSCWAGAAGPAHAKAIRELSGTLVAEDVANGWFVAVGGFFDEARTVAKERDIALIDGEDLLGRLRQLPRFALVRALGRASG